MAKKSTGVALAVAWPLAKKVATQVSVIVANNPEIQKRLEGLGKKFADVQKARTPEAKIARAMESVREQAEIVLRSESGDAESVASLQAAGWKQRADQVERALRILQHQPRKKQKAQLQRIEAMADSLVAEVLTSLIDEVEAPRDQLGGT
ncbi:hypothetical protein [Cellulomonas xylanilytica]|uniref:Uncharacterized protein n=1 Tax=Cellulomonas xylanilytica TaxID=233583 RepID=A0A510VCJ9_9CELL|nr:hypothetical protein [Cellulomonas xylanilytica]GEK22885.1 hypothetical protein CXY01_34050 [Cellulomonas xylanilytica]